jgi:hypothetical protein
LTRDKGHGNEFQKWVRHQCIAGVPWLSIFVLHALFAALQEEDEEDNGEESAFII